MLFVAVGKQITSCYKAAVYHIPLVKRIMDASPADTVFSEPSDNLHEDPFVPPDVLGYPRMPDPARWAAPNILNRLLGILKLARTLGVNPIVEHLSSALEIAPEALKLLKTGAFRKKIRDQLRCVHLLCFKSILIRCSRCAIHHKECLECSVRTSSPGLPVFVFCLCSQ